MYILPAVLAQENSTLCQYSGYQILLYANCDCFVPDCIVIYHQPFTLDYVAIYPIHPT
jgi:hypothetical protein